MFQRHVYVLKLHHIDHFLAYVFNALHLSNGLKHYINALLHLLSVNQTLCMIQKLNHVYAHEILHLMMVKNVNHAIYQCIGVM